jgi:superfamily II DNA or RNA helicase
MAPVTVGRYGYRIKRKCVSDDLLVLIEKELIIHPKSIMETVKIPPYNVFRASEHYYYLPMYWGIKNVDVNYNIDFAYNGRKQNFEFKMTLFDEQIKIVDSLLQYYINFETGLYKPFGACILNVDTGIGKTPLSLFVASILMMKFIVVCHTDEIGVQWMEEGPKFINGIVAQKYSSGKPINPNTNMLIISIQTMMKKDYSEILSGFDFIIYDETHHYASAKFSEALLHVNIPYKLGLTATIERRDGQEQVVYHHLNEIGFRQIEALDQYVRVNIYRFDTDNKNFKKLCFGNGTTRFSEMMNRLCMVEERNRLICNLIVESLEESDMSRQILIITHRRDHMDYLTLMLVNEFNIDPKQIGHYVGGITSKKKREKMRKSVRNKRIIIGSYVIMQEGVSIKSLDTVIIATPQNKIIQSCGRIFRKKKELYDNIPTILDISDQIDPYMGMENSRLVQYKDKYMKHEENVITFYTCEKRNNFKIKYLKELHNNEIFSNEESKKMTKDKMLELMMEDSDSDSD